MTTELELCALRESERAKYKKVWSHSVVVQGGRRIVPYAHHSPGANAVPQFLTWARPNPGSTVLDFGCGTGKASLRMAGDGGLRPRLQDFVDARVDEARCFPFFQRCLWDLPVERCDYLFCADVMEHIPEPAVDMTLRLAAAATEHLAWFQISLRPDDMGQMVGETLHVTVRRAGWWIDRLRQHFDLLLGEVQDNDALVVGGRPARRWGSAGLRVVP